MMYDYTVLLVPLFGLVICPYLCMMYDDDDDDNNGIYLVR